MLAVMAENGLKRGENGLQVYVMCEIPSNVILAKEFAERFDGFSIGSNDLTQLTLGVDRDSAELAGLFDEQDEAVKWMIHSVIEAAHQAGAKVGLCGQAPSDHPEFAEFLVECGIDSMSVSPDSFLAVKERVAASEAAAPKDAAPTEAGVSRMIPKKVGTGFRIRDRCGRMIDVQLSTDERTGKTGPAAAGPSSRRVAASARKPRRRRGRPGRCRASIRKCPFCPGHESELPGILAETPAPGAPGWTRARGAEQVPGRAGAGRNAARRRARRPCRLRLPRSHHREPAPRCRARHLVGGRAAGGDAPPIATARGCCSPSRASRPWCCSATTAPAPALRSCIRMRRRSRSTWCRRGWPRSMNGASAITPSTASAPPAKNCRSRPATAAAWSRKPSGSSRWCRSPPSTLTRSGSCRSTIRRRSSISTEEALAEFGDLLARCLRRLKKVLNDPPYNFVVNSAPKHEFGAAHFHWRLRLVPQVAVWGGFELGGGLPINPSSPEDDAAALRAAPIETA